VELGLLADVGFDLAKLGRDLVDDGVVFAVASELVLDGVKLSAKTREVVLVNRFEVRDTGVKVGRGGVCRESCNRSPACDSFGGGPGPGWLLVGGGDLALEHVEPREDVADALIMAGGERGGGVDEVIAKLDRGGGGCESGGLCGGAN